MPHYYGNGSTVSASVAKKVLTTTQAGWMPPYLFKSVDERTHWKKSPQDIASWVLTDIFTMPPSVQTTMAGNIGQSKRSRKWEKTLFEPYSRIFDFRQHMRRRLDCRDLDHASAIPPTRFYVTMKELRKPCSGLAYLESKSKWLTLKTTAEGLMMDELDSQEERPQPTKCICEDPLHIPFPQPIPQIDETMSDDEEFEEVDEMHAVHEYQRRTEPITKRIKTYHNEAPKNGWPWSIIAKRLVNYESLMAWAITELAHEGLVFRALDKPYTGSDVMAANWWVQTHLDSLGIEDRVKFAYHLIDILNHNWTNMSVYKESLDLTATWCRPYLPFYMENLLKDEYVALAVCGGQPPPAFASQTFRPPRVSMTDLDETSKKLLSEMMIIHSPSKSVAFHYFALLTGNFTIGRWLWTRQFRLLRYYCNPFQKNSFYPADELLKINGPLRRRAYKIPDLKKKWVGMLKIGQKLKLEPYYLHQAIARIMEYLDSIHTPASEDPNTVIVTIMLDYDINGLADLHEDIFWELYALMKDEDPRLTKVLLRTIDEDKRTNVETRMRRFHAFSLTEYEILIMVARGMMDTVNSDDFRNMVLTGLHVMYTTMMCPPPKGDKTDMVALAATCLAIGLNHTYSNGLLLFSQLIDLDDDDDDDEPTTMEAMIMSTIKSSWTHPTIKFDDFKELCFAVLFDPNRGFPVGLEEYIAQIEDYVFRDLATLCEKEITIHDGDNSQNYKPTISAENIPELSAFDEMFFQDKFSRCRVPTEVKLITPNNHTRYIY